MNRMKRCGNPPTMQTIQRVDGQLYQTLNTRRMRNAAPLQTIKRERTPKPFWLIRATFILGALVLILSSLAAGLLLPR